MKEKYFSPCTEIEQFKAVDVVTTSTGTSTTVDDRDPGDNDVKFGE